MKVFWLVCLTLFTLAVAQHDHASVGRGALNLAQSQGNTTFHKEFTATSGNNTIVARSCQYYTHSVTNVQTTANTGYYFSIKLDVTGTASGVEVILSDTTGNDLYDIRFVSTNPTDSTINSYTGLCTGSGCLFEYYCEFYTPRTSLLITISTPCNQDTTTLTTGKYDLTFTQYAETVQTIPASRSLSVGTSTLVAYSVTNPGPKNFAQFFHQLNPTPAESSDVVDLFIEANFTTSGSWLICYNENYLVNSFQPSSFFSTIDTGSSDSQGCGTVCRLVTSAVATIRITGSSCDLSCGINQNFWIGVAPSSGASVTTSFTIKLYYGSSTVGFTFPTITQIVSNNFETEGFLTQPGAPLCDPQAGDFSCADFYSFTLASIGFSTANINKDIAPRVRISLYGVLNGNVQITVQKDAITLTGFDCDCDTSYSCQAGDFLESECVVLLHPCVWSSDYSDEWVISISSLTTSGYDGSYPTTYGLRLEAGSFFSATVPLSYWITPSRNSISIQDSHVYKVIITENDVTPDTIFTAQLFSDTAQENLVFYVLDSLDCNASPIFACVNYGEYSASSSDSCKFSFTPCADTWVAGTTLYFVVSNYYFPGQPYSPTSTSETAFQRDVEYTINWKLQRASPVYQGITNIETTSFSYAYYYYDGDELTAQQYIDVPADDTISRVRVIVSNVRGGTIRTYFNIDDFAGTCNHCFDAVSSCTAVSDYTNANQNSYNLYDCEFLISGCHVRGRRIYFASELLELNRFLNFPSYYDPIGYTITVHFDKVSSEPQVIEASRAGAAITGSINRAFDYYYPEDQGLENIDNTRFFKVDFTNAALSDNDAIRFTIAFTALYQQQYKPEVYGQFYEFTNSIGMTVADNGYSVIFPQNYINENYDGDLATDCSNLWQCVASTNSYDYGSSRFQGGYDEGLYSQCSVVIQPCETLACGARAGLANVYYISVRNLADYSQYFERYRPYYYYYYRNKRSDGGQNQDRYNDVDFNIKVQVVSQDPISLTSNVALTGRLDPAVYVHFKFAVPTQIPANSWFTAMFYSNTDEYIYGVGSYQISTSIGYYMHYVAPNEQIVQAGFTGDCYAHDLCNVCQTNYLNPECYYQVSPCDFNQNAGGTYYLSAYAVTFSDYELFFDFGADFTIKVAIENIEELLVTNYPPVSSYVFSNTADYYSLTVPALPSGVAGWVLSLRLESVKYGDAYISLNDIAPESDCECSKVAYTVAENNIFSARYYPCEITPGKVLYLTVEGIPTDNYQPVSYTVHAHLDPFTVRDITLNGTVSGQIGQSLDVSFTLNWDQFIAYRFSVNGGAGKMLAVSVSSDLTQDTFYAALSKGNVSTSFGNTPTSSYIYSNDATCQNAVRSCQYSNANGCNLLAIDCDVADSGSETWFLTFDGSQLRNLHSSGTITFKIRVINPSTFTFPTNTTTPSVTNTITTGSTVDNAFGITNYVSSTSVGLSAGNSYSFDVSGSSSGVISFNGESCSPLCDDDCIVYACSDVSAGVWRFSFRGSGSIVITLGTTRYGNTTVTSIPANTQVSIPTIATDNWAYYSISAPAQTSGSFSLDSTGFSSPFYFLESTTPFLFPRFPNTPSFDVYGLSNSGVSLGSCGASFTATTLGATCCYDAFTQVFAIQPTSTTVGGTITFTTTQFVETALTTQSTPFAILSSPTLGLDKVDTIPFTVAANTDIWISLTTNTTGLQVFLNRGSNAGVGTGSGAAQCWDSFYSTGALCPNGFSPSSPCQAFIDVCDTCFGESVSQTYYLSIYNSNTNGFGAAYNVTVATQTAFDTVVANSPTTLRFPSPSGSVSIVDSRTSGTFEVYTHFVFDYSRLIVDDIVNFVPLISDLNNGQSINFPRVFFNLNSIRLANGTAVSLTNQNRVIDLFVSRNGGICDSNPAPIPGSPLCLESGSGSYQDGQFNCTVSVCDLSCSSLYWSVKRNSADTSTNQYTFNFAATEQYNGINVVTPPIRIVEIDIGASGSNFLSLNSSTQAITYYKVNIGSQFALNDNTKRYTDFKFTFQSASSQGTLNIAPYDAECATSTNSGDSINAGESFIYTTQPTDFEDVYGNSISTVFYYRTQVSGLSAASYNITLQWNTTAVSVIPVTLSPVSDYVATKEIFDLDWHFFEFTAPLNGYYTLDLTISSLCCSAANADLDIYTSFSSGTTSEIVDTARPNRYPDEVHHVTSTTLTTGSGGIRFSIPLTCNNYGGVYRVSIFAKQGTQYASAYPAIYDIQAALTEDVHVKLNLGCTFTTSTVHLFEIEPEANNRGSSLQVYVAGSSGNILYVSSNGRPFDGGRCDWTEGDGYVSQYQDYQDNSFIAIPVCSYTNDKWFVYVDYTGTITIGTLFLREYIPTVTPTPKYTTSAQIYPAQIQYFKVNVPDSKYSGFRAAIEQCEGAGLGLSVTYGDAGFSAYGRGTWDEESCGNDFSSCNDYSCRSQPNPSGVSTCAITYEGCSGNSVYFVGVYNPTSSVYDYTLQITADFKDEVVPVYLGVPNCFAINCHAYFQVLNADGTTPAITDLSTVTVNINSATSANFAVSVSTDSLATNTCYDQSQSCSQGLCPFTLCSVGSDLFIYVRSLDFSADLVDSPFASCPTNCASEFVISITASFTTATVSSLTVGGTSTSTYSSFTLASTGQSVSVSNSIGYTQDTFCTTAGRSTCSVLYPDTVDHEYFFYNAGVSLSTPSVSVLTTTPTSYTLDPSVGYLHFSYTPAANKRVASIDFTNINYCVKDLVSGQLPVYIHYHADYVPFTNCGSCDSGSQLEFASCGVDGKSLLTPLCEAGPVYFSICADVSDFVCPLSFQVSVTEVNTLALGSSHLESNFVHVSQSVDGQLCEEAASSYTYFVDVTGPFFVGVREAVGADVSVNVYSPASDGVSCDSFGSCVAFYDDSDSYSTCGVSSCDHCASPSRYEVEVTLSNINNYGYSFDIIAINQYLPLTSPVTTTIGNLKHFYSYTAAAFQSLVFKLTVQTGPALQLTVFEGCQAEYASFEENVVCAFDDCFVYVPTQAKRSDATTYYLVLTSSSFAGNSQLDRNTAVSSVKATAYTLQVTAGTQNCIAASSLVSSAPFCSDVFKNISSVSVWSFADVASKDAEAKCLYNNIAGDLSCPKASNDCLNWLHVLSCLITFPQCDSNGFQQGVCRPVCSQVDDYCGADWETQISAFYEDYDCASAFYVDSNSSTCYPIPSPPPPPSSVDDYKPVSAGPAVLEPFEVPVFSDVTIYLTTGEFASYSQIFTSGSTDNGGGQSTITASEISSLFTSGVFGSASTLCMGAFTLVFLVLML